MQEPRLPVQIKLSPLHTERVIECPSCGFSHLLDELTGMSINYILPTDRDFPLKCISQQLLTIYFLECRIYPNRFKVTLKQVDDVTDEIFIAHIIPCRV